MLTTKLTQEPGILTQASSGKLRHNASLKQNLPVRKYLFNKSTKDKKYGTKIRLHQAGYQQLEQGRSQHCAKFLLDDVFYRSNKNYGRKQNRDFVPDRISSGAGDGSLDSQTIDPSGQKTDQKIDRLRNQCWGKIYGKIYEPMDENFQVQNPGQNARKIASIKISLSWIRGHWPRIFFDPAGAATNCRRDKKPQAGEPQAASHKPQAPGFRIQATSNKQQATSNKL